MDKVAQEKIAKRIEDETKGGYLQSWEEYNTSLTQEQQWDYFLILGHLILKDLKNLGYHKLPKDRPELRQEIGDLINDCVNRNSFTSTDLDQILALIKG